MWISLKKKRLIDFFFGFLFFARSFLLHLGFSSCGERGLLLSWSVGLSLPWLLLWWSASSGRVASAVAARRLRSCDLQALGRELSSCGAQAWLLQRVRDLPLPGMEPVSLVFTARWILNLWTTSETPMCILKHGLYVLFSLLK